MDAATLSYPSPDGPRPALWAAPEGWSGGPALVMVHENKGLTDYMRAMASELAGLGYAVLAPDLMSRIGDPEATTRALPMGQHVADIVAALDHLEQQADRVALVGFCFGAEAAMLAALDRAELAAVVAWYGIPPRPEDTSRLTAPLLLMLAADDDRVNRHVPAFLDGLAAEHSDYVVESFPGTLHAFHDRTRPERHHPAAAEAAWAEQERFLRRHLT